MAVKKLIVSITGRKKKDWLDKLKEIDRYKIKEVALFMQLFPPSQKKGLLKALKNSSIKKIPLVHIREDTTKKEIDFLTKHFSSRYFTIHEYLFNRLTNWRGDYQKLYLEMSTDDRVAPYVQVEKIGGFCIDLAHYKKQAVWQTKDYVYIVEHLQNIDCSCNHLSGYSYKTNLDLHTVTSVRDFDYIYQLPHNLFGKVIALEIFNPIREQIKYQKLLKKSIKKKLGFTII